MTRDDGHDFPLADRLVTGAINEWLDTATAKALASVGDVSSRDLGFRQGVDQMRFLHLDGAYYTIVPKILDLLRRAGLLVEADVSTDQER